MAGSRSRPFRDSNVLFSGLYRPDSVPGLLLDRHTQGIISAAVSALVLDEVARNLLLKRPAALPPLEELLHKTAFEIVPAPSADAIRAVAHCINARDAPVLAAAVACGADCIVSGNTRHFTQQTADCAGIAIFTPAAYLTALDHTNGIRR